MSVGAILNPPDAAEPTSEPQKARGRILVIDDSGVVRKILKNSLQAEGFEVETADGGKTGIPMAEASRFDLIVIDGMMPGMDGFSVCRELAKTKVNGRPLLVMHTNLYKDFKDRLEAPSAGADEFVLKVLDGSPLVQKVKQLLSPSPRG